MVEPYAVTTRSNEVVLRKTLEAYKIQPEPTDADTEDVFSKKFKGKELAKKTVFKSIERSKQLRELSSVTGYGLYNLQNPPYNPRALALMMEMNTYHNRCCKTKATDTCGLGWYLDPITEDPQESNFNTLMTFFNNCSPTFEDVVTPAQTDLEGIGWLSIELIRIKNKYDGQPERLEHIPSQTIRIHKDANRFMQSWYGYDTRWFKLIGSTNDDGKQFDVDMRDGEISEFGMVEDQFRANDMIYITNYTCTSTYYGVPDGVTTFKTIIGDQAAVEYNVTFFKNFGIPNYAVFVTGYFEDEKEVVNGKETGKTVLQSKIEKKLNDIIDNPHSSLIFMIPTGDPATKVQVEFKPLAVEQKDMQFRLYRQENRDEIVSAHMMDPYRVGIMQTGSLGGNTAIESKKNYKIGTIAPRQRKLEAYINNYIIASEVSGFGITDYQLKFKSLDIEDKNNDLEIAKQIFEMGGCRPIDIIMKYGKDIFDIEITDDIKNNPALNKFYILNTNIPIDDASQIQQVSGNMPENKQMAQETAEVLKELREKIAEKVDKL